MGRMTKNEREEHEARLAKFIKRFRIKTKNGMLVLYKAVRKDLGSWWTTENSGPKAAGGIYTPGTEVKCRRCDRNPRETCGRGLHVSTESFARQFQKTAAPTIIQVLVDPKDVVCVPIPYWAKKSVRKIRVRRLYVDKIVVKDKRRSSANPSAEG